VHQAEHAGSDSASAWSGSRYGSHAGRGFRYQDAVAAALATQCITGEPRNETVIPEGLDDVTLRRPTLTIHAQVKSRRSHLGPFRVAEAAQHLLDLWSRHRARVRGASESRLALVLESDIEGLPQTGWVRVAADVDGLADAIGSELMHRGVASEEVDQLLALAHVIVIPDPADDAVGELTPHLRVAPAVAWICYLTLLNRVAYLSDENGVREADNPAVLTAQDVERLMHDTVAVVDASALEAVVREGVCEPVDFMAPIVDPEFLSGVDVVPGHVVAGLTFDRPEEVDSVRRALDRRRVAIVVGPSGSGKSGVIWMTAFDTRHVVRWYRVVRLSELDVAPLVRFVAAMRPTERARVGLVVDDLGQPGHAGWDLLVEETMQRPGLLLLGGVREEDLASLATHHALTTVRPTLDASLAKSMWHGLRQTGSTPWTEWREPFEASQGLLLEYAHLLTRGERLAQTIARQVERRLQEERDLELQVIRIVAAAASWGGIVNVHALQQALSVSDEDLQRTLSRLLDEHMVRRVSAEHVGGLHALRSAELVKASHLRPPPTIPATVETALDLIEPPWIPAVVSGAITSDAIPSQRVIERLATRVTSEQDPALVTASLEGLRMADAITQAHRWVAIMDAAQVPAAVREITATLALIQADVADLDFLPSIRQAIPKLTAAAEEEDLRDVFLERVPAPLLDRAIGRIDRPEAARTLLASAAEVRSQKLQTALLGLRSMMSEIELAEASAILRLARRVDPGLATTLATATGSVEERLTRVATEVAWTRNVRMEADTSARTVVSADWLYLGAARQDDPHEQVVETCRLLAGLFPEADIFAVRAVDATGEPAGYGDHRIADKRMERRYLIGPEEVGWNRYRVGLVNFIVGSGPVTTRIEEERNLLLESLDALVEAGNVWCTGHRPSAPLAARLERITQRATALAPATGDPGSPSELMSRVSSASTGRAADLARMIAGNGVPRLFDPTSLNWALAAFLHDTLGPSARALLEEGYWRLLSDPPLRAVTKLLSALEDLHAVVAERLAGDPGSAAALRRAARQGGDSALAGAASEARRRASKRFDSTLEKLGDRLRRDGFRIEFGRRPPVKPTGLLWPIDDVAVLVEASSSFDWLAPPEDVIAACRRAFEPVRHVLLVPFRDGRVVSALGGRLDDRNFYPLPDLASSWAEDLPLPLLAERGASSTRHWINAVGIISGVLASNVGREPSRLEIEALQTATEDRRVAEEALLQFTKEPHGEVVSEVASVLQSLAGDLEAEVSIAVGGTEPPVTVAARLARMIQGREPELQGTLAACQAAMLEWDVDREGASTRVQAALDALGHGSEGELEA
jgi:hypothetical protein